MRKCIRAIDKSRVKREFARVTFVLRASLNVYRDPPTAIVGRYKRLVSELVPRSLLLISPLAAAQYDVKVSVSWMSHNANTRRSIHKTRRVNAASSPRQTVALSIATSSSGRVIISLADKRARVARLSFTTMLPNVSAASVGVICNTRNFSRGGSRGRAVSQLLFSSNCREARNMNISGDHENPLSTRRFSRITSSFGLS